MSIQDSLFAAPAVLPRALTVRQPWASLITSGLKDVENRSKPTSYRGTLLIHAGLATDADAMTEHGHLLGDYPAGVFLGTVDLVDCVHRSASPWAMDGYWHWILENPRPAAELVRAAGQLGLWSPDPAGWAAVEASLAA